MGNYSGLGRFLDFGQGIDGCGFANWWGKIKTVAQITAIVLLLAPLSQAWTNAGLVAFWLSVVLTLVSGAIYLIPQMRGDEEIGSI